MNISPNIIKEINRLEFEELEVLNNLILERMKEIDKKQAFLDNYIGIGTGIWVTDAQEYVNELRVEQSPEEI